MLWIGAGRFHVANTKMSHTSNNRITGRAGQQTKPTSNQNHHHHPWRRWSILNCWVLVNSYSSSNNKPASLFHRQAVGSLPSRYHQRGSAPGYATPHHTTLHHTKLGKINTATLSTSHPIRLLAPHHGRYCCCRRAAHGHARVRKHTKPHYAYRQDYYRIYILRRNSTLTVRKWA